MKTCKRCGLLKQITEFRKAIGMADGLRSKCKKCECLYTKEWNASNTKHRAQYQKEYGRKRHATLSPQQRCERNEKWRQWYANNAMSCRLQARKKYVEHPELHTQQHKRARKYRQAHPEMETARSAKKRASQLLATPSWADKKAIAAMYTLSVKLSIETGIIHHVDHQVPLQSRLVCGLHVEHNLQVIPATVNLKKYNRVWPDMP